MLSRWPPLRMSSGGGVATWAYDSIIYSGVSRWGRDVYCIVGVTLILLMFLGNNQDCLVMTLVASLVPKRYPRILQA